MRELQKYYATTSELYRTVCSSGDVCTAVYLAAEADTAFAEKDQHHKQIVEILETRIANMREQSAFIDKQHAEEIERLKAEHEEGLAGFHRSLYALQEETDSVNHEFKNFHRLLCDRFGYVHDDRDWRRDQISLIEHIASLRKQAERYQKLKGIGSRSLERLLWQSLDDPTSFDALVDQLPASGQAPS